MPAYVTLPGTSGNYFDTPDVNFLDADTAHQHQSRGKATGGFQVANIAQSQDLTPVFGDYHGEFTPSGAVSSSFLYLGDSGTSAHPVAAGTEVTLSFNAGSDQADMEMSGQFTWYNAGGSTLSDSTLSYNAVGQNSLTTRITYTVTAPANTAFARPRIVARAASGNMAGTDVCYWDAATFRTGSDGTFVPSLRIVNDLEIEWKVALDDYTPAATNTILDCLNSNDGYRIRHTTGDAIEIAYGNGSSTRAQTSSATGLTDGNEHVFKVTVDQSTGAVIYYIDGVQHDTDTMTAGAGQRDINDLVVGANAAASANWTDGDIYYVIVRDGIDGPVVARFDADDWVGV